MSTSIEYDYIILSNGHKKEFQEFLDDAFNIDHKWIENVKDGEVVDVRTREEDDNYVPLFEMIEVSKRYDGLIFICRWRSYEYGVCGWFEIRDSHLFSNQGHEMSVKELIDDIECVEGERDKYWSWFNINLS